MINIYENEKLLDSMTVEEKILFTLIRTNEIRTPQLIKKITDYGRIPATMNTSYFNGVRQDVFESGTDKLMYEEINKKGGGYNFFCEIENWINEIYKKYQYEQCYIASPASYWDISDVVRKHEEFYDTVYEMLENNNRGYDAIIAREELSKVSGLPFGIISNSYTAHMLYMMQNLYKINSEIKAADARFTQRYLEHDAQMTFTACKKTQEYSNKVVIPELCQLLVKYNQEFVESTAEFFSIDLAEFYNKYASELKESRDNEINELKRIEDEKKRKEQERRAEVQRKRDALNEMIDNKSKELDAIGFAIFGEKAKQKKMLKYELDELKKKLSDLY